MFQKVSDQNVLMWSDSRILILDLFFRRSRTYVGAMVCQAEVHLLNFDEAVWVGGVRCFPTRLEIRFANSSANHSNALRDFINIFSPSK